MARDGRLARGDRTRAAVLDTAVALATRDGLDGLSLAQVAEELGISKSALFAHWRSKEDLQLATIEHAREQWLERVISPALREPRGVRRLRALHERRIAFYAESVLPGGCFFGNVQFEFNVREGPIRARLAEIFTDWLAMLERLAREAIELGELVPDTDPALLAYESEAFGLAAVMQSRLLGTAAAYDLALRSMRARLRALSTDPEEHDE
ncbi:TetR/AcrR family transcriptional regulator [Catenuloplanes atrovinosus]|uniref:AcrR family transcriptional regulator n=1 Tax=Catenuloplanes atrovinosus TaxID=137266 RepID=A0AAE4CD52_9ACTN|nr:TetR/AcrR family transcriptional regulator [Catenuloplanes atrovinosus]MDR7279853.1 AcrR family transcriptional regulator [Catenuloplanes atrovinosus]